MAYRTAKWSLVFAFFAVLQGFLCQTARPCSPKVYHGAAGGTVCVCNATYCDDVENIGAYAQNIAFVYSSSASGQRLQKSTAAWRNSSLFDNRRMPVMVNVSRRYQSIIGLGGAFTDTAGININSLSPGAKQNLINSYFSRNGLQYSLGRVPLASCDASTHEYSYDEYDQDFQLTNFSLTDEDRQLKIPIIRQATQLTGGDLKLFASPWSAPSWMKTNGHMRGGGTLKGVPGGPYYTTWANYFVKFLDAYAGHNISFWGLTIQNEPLLGALPDFPWQTMYLNVTMQRDFIANTLGPILRRSIYGQRIALMTMDDQRSLLPDWADIVFADTQASFYTAGVAVQWYLDTAAAPTKLRQTHDRHPEKFILLTEAAAGEFVGPNLGDWSRADDYAHDIIENMNNYVAGWTDWNLAVDTLGGPNWARNFFDAAIVVNASADEFYKQPMFYAIGHFSKFIRPNSTVIDLSIDQASNLEGVAVLTPSNEKVLVIVNRLQTGVSQLAIEDTEKPGMFLEIDLQPQSIVTIIWM